MGLKTCKDCAGMVSGSARSCPHCGRQGNKYKYIKRALKIIAVMIILSYLASLINNNDKYLLLAVIIIPGLFLLRINAIQSGNV